MTEPTGVSSSIKDTWVLVVPTTSVAWGEVQESPTIGGDGGAGVSSTGTTKNQDVSIEDGSWMFPPCPNRGKR